MTQMAYKKLALLIQSINIKNTNNLVSNNFKIPEDNKINNKNFKCHKIIYTAFNLAPDTFIK